MCNGSMRQWVLLVALAFFQGRARIARSMRSSASYGRAQSKIDAQQRILRESKIAPRSHCAAAHPTGERMQDRCAAAHPTGERTARSMRRAHRECDRCSASYGRAHQDHAQQRILRESAHAQQRILRESALQDRCAAAHPTGERTARSMRSSASYGSAQQRTLRGERTAKTCATAHATCYSSLSFRCGTNFKDSELIQ
jgi:hypothetical protein